MRPPRVNAICMECRKFVQQPPGSMRITYCNACCEEDGHDEIEWRGDQIKRRTADSRKAAQ